LKAALCRFRFAFISLSFLIYSKPAKIEINPWSNFRGPPHTLGAYIFQGFNFTGFHLSEQSLNWLGAATIGQIAGLLAIVIRQK
jgi:hypothetical protein